MRKNIADEWGRLSCCEKVPILLNSLGMCQSSTVCLPPWVAMILDSLAPRTWAGEGMASLQPSGKVRSTYVIAQCCQPRTDYRAAGATVHSDWC